MPRLTRRSFLTGAGATVGMTAAGGVVWLAQRDLGRTAVAPSTTTATASSGASSTSSTVADSTAPSPTSTAVAPPTGAPRVLVVVQLGGGNDALDTLVPIDGRYHDLRPTLALADESLLTLPGTGAYGLHPSLAPLQPLLAAGRVATLAGVGYPDPTRSHFAALDDWWSATPGRASTTGWLGRWLDGHGGDAPLGAVALGAGAPALVGDRVRPTVVLSPDTFRAMPPARTDLQLRAVGPAASDTGAAARYRAAVAAAAQAVDTFASLASASPPDDGDEADAPVDAGEITAGLATAARLIGTEPGVRVVQVAVNGFDTHADQRADHDRLLADLAGGVAEFFTSLAATGDDQRVVLMTVSEFGRRAAENGSGGTDHGKAGVQFVVGPSVTGGLYGALDLGALDDGDLPMRIDVRSVYADVLGWLGGPVDEVLGARYEPVGVLRA